MYKNNLIELFPAEVKEKLYTALENGDKVYGTRNRRGIPADTFVYDTKDYYLEVIINPIQKLECYTDFRILTIEQWFVTLGHTQEDLIEYVKFFEDSPVGDFRRMLNMDMCRRMNYQYDAEEIEKYLLSMKEEVDSNV